VVDFLSHLGFILTIVVCSLPIMNTLRVIYDGRSYTVAFGDWAVLGIITIVLAEAIVFSALALYHRWISSNGSDEHYVKIVAQSIYAITVLHVLSILLIIFRDPISHIVL
jgi:hypothetical protein